MTSSLKKSWLKSAARWTVAMAAGLLLSHESPAQVKSAGPGSPAAPETEQRTEQRSAASVFELRQAFGAVSLGRDLMNYADRNGVVTLEDDARLRLFGAKAQYLPDEGALVLRSTPADAEKIIEYAHELWHMRQDKMLHAFDAEATFLKPEQRWALREYMEADARAFSAYFYAAWTKQLGIAIDPAQEAFEFRTAALLRAEMDKPEGLTLARYRELALAPAFAQLSPYHKILRDVIGKFYQGAHDEISSDPGDSINAAYRHVIAAAPDDAAFESLLRRFGGLALDGKAPTSLQDKTVSSDLLLNGYPYVLQENRLVSIAMAQPLRLFFENANALYDSVLKKSGMENERSGPVRKSALPSQSF